MSVLDALKDRFFREVFIQGVYPVFPEAKIVFDIGSLALEYSIKVYPYAETIVAIEPHPIHAKAIRNAIEEYELKKINFFEVALDRNSEMKWFGRLDDYGGSVLKTTPTELKVKTVTMNELMDMAGVDHVDVMKMDIEGYESEVLSDGFPFDKVKNMFLEVHFGKRDYITSLLADHYELEFNNYSVCIARHK